MAVQQDNGAQLWDRQRRDRLLQTLSALALVGAGMEVVAYLVHLPPLCDLIVVSGAASHLIHCLLHRWLRARCPR